RDFRGFRAEPAGLSRRGTHLSVAHAGGGPRGARRSAGPRAHSNVLPGALRDSGCGASGLCVVLRARAAFPPHDGLSAVHVAGECDCAGYETGERDSMVAPAFGIFFAAGWERPAHSGAGFGSAGAPEKGAPLPVPAEVAEAHFANQSACRRVGLLRRARNPTNRRARGYGSADVAVIA